jgi:hypothetical protein
VRVSLCVALVIADNVIAASLVANRRAPRNSVSPGSVISAAWRDDSIIGIGNVLIAAVSPSGSTPL